MSEEQQESSVSDNPKSRKRRRRRGGSAGAAAPTGAAPAAAESSAPRSPQPQQRPRQQPQQQPRARQQQPARAKQRSRDDRPAEAPYRLKTPADKFGGREPVALPRTIDEIEQAPLNGFELFCAYHLGITEDNQHRRQSPRDVARRFGITPDDLQDALQRFGLDTQTINQCSYDMELALLDIRVAPEGIDRRELAKGLYDELLDLNPSARAAEQEPELEQDEA
jgi:hypothetical protein